LGIDLPIVAAEGFEEGKPLGNASVIQKMIKVVFDQTGIPAAAKEDFLNRGRMSLDGLLVECLERGDDRRDIMEQVPVGVRVRRYRLLWRALGFDST